MQSDHGEGRVDDENHDVRDALIIAAGKGSRLSGRGDLKPLIPVLDVALIELVIGAGIESGIVNWSHPESSRGGSSKCR